MPTTITNPILTIYPLFFFSKTEYLEISENFWAGDIPDVFSDYENLEYFAIAGNEAITGSIPETLFLVDTIRFIYMQECPGLEGTIPNSFSDPPDLRDLYLYSTQISGNVPSVPGGKLEKLNEFLIHDTQLSGAMPSSVCGLREEHILDDLWADCGGPKPKIQCSFPDCCNRCFEGGVSS